MTNDPPLKRVILETAAVAKYCLKITACIREKVPYLPISKAAPTVIMTSFLLSENLLSLYDSVHSSDHLPTASPHHNPTILFS